jgi:glycosyltransferase involved in cell wall biosynthesis
MKILQVCKKFPWPARDGESLAILGLTRGFALAGHEVTVLGMNTPKHHFDPGFLPESLRETARFFAVDVDTRVRLLPAALNLLTGQSYNLERFFSADFQSGLRRLLRETPFDLIQLEGLYLAPYFQTIRRETTAPVVMRAHNVEFEIWEKLAANEPRWHKKRYFGLLARRMRRFEVASLNHYSALVPISPVDAARFAELGARLPMHTCPAGMMPGEYRLNPARPPADSPAAAPAAAEPASAASRDQPARQLRVGYLGALDWLPNREGLDWFIERVWPLVRERFAGAEFRVAGRNAPAAWLSRQEPGVSLLGEVEDARAFLAEQDVVVMPLLSGSGMRIKLLEALAMARPVVASSQAAEGVPLVSGQHALLADEPAEFARAVIGLLQDPARARSMGLEGRAHVFEHYDQEKLVYGLLEFYHQQFGL